MDDFDYIIIGAGTAGCVLANRLSASGADRVLVLEAGGSDASPWLRVPVGYAHSYNNPGVNWMYTAAPDAGLDHRAAFWPRGKVLGGSSSINAMVYVRGQPTDFDDWAALGNPGWGYRDVLPYFKKLEDHAWGASEYHGAGGPVHVTDISAAVHPVCENFIAACVERGVARTRDFNGAQPEGAGIWQLLTRDGLRVSASTAYLRPARRRENLVVRTRALATRLRLEGRRAVGVEYLAGDSRHIANARREVLVCAGSVNSPQLLQLSGIGAASLLGRLGIPVVHDLPTVGQGLQDHLAVSYFYRSRVPTLNNVLRPLSGRIRAALEYAFTRRGPLSMSVNQAGAFVRSRPGLDRPNLHIYFNPLSYTAAPAGTRRAVRPDAHAGFLMSFNTCRPTSRGRIEIASADPEQAPLIQPNSLTTEADVADVYDGARYLRSLVAATPLAAIAIEEVQPGAASQGDAAALADFRARAASVFHASCTCAMGPDPTRSVVDARLRVHGIEHLRVVDTSVFPTVTSGNTTAPTLMVGEKGADLILQDR